MNEWQVPGAALKSLNGRKWVLAAAERPIATWPILAAHRANLRLETCRLERRDFPVSPSPSVNFGALHSGINLGNRATPTTGSAISGAAFSHRFPIGEGLRSIETLLGTWQALQYPLDRAAR
jgi:hypothetical protein